ncbi:RCC1 domain-containing protein [Chondromyces apiculatus]|uniref:Regulator of chromosome condensation, RCC1 n=1 Tax=Chondromyces apiculatus DSM 436 TaxID=1192034 RepID=A0A017T751_9BACT|nr:hypothetical protein [Chondromyces apiculatus]EYF05063.1 regulator of chromosome condensation, RCC1 [Chondromyces apiculatus DSM 436]
MTALVRLAAGLLLLLPASCRKDTSPTVVDVIPGDQTTQVVTADGRLFGFGKADTLGSHPETRERLQLGKNTPYLPYPVPLDPALAVKKGAPPFRVATEESPRGAHTVDALEVASNGTTTCVVRLDRTVACWGSNTYGALGRGDTTSTHDYGPAPVVGLSGARALGIGSWHACALLQAGRVACWGVNHEGQLGVTLPTGVHHAASPVTPAGLPPIRQLALGASHTCALAEDGTVFCWGYAWDGQTGNGEHGVGQRVPTPARVAGLAGVEALVSSPLSYHTCARLSDRTATCWGRNDKGQIGNGKSGDEHPATRPSAVLGLQGVSLIATGADHTCAIVDPGRLLCWGSDFLGQLGDDGASWLSPARPEPVAVRWK